MNAHVRLIKTPQGFVAPQPGEEAQEFTLLDLCNHSQVAYFDLSALRSIAEAARQQLKLQGVDDVRVQVAADELDAEGRDIRPPGDTMLTLMIYPETATGSQVAVDSSDDQMDMDMAVHTPQKAKKSYSRPVSRIKRQGISVDYQLLYWKAQEQGLGFTNGSSYVPTTSDFTEKGLIDPHFEWNYGFRLGAGYQTTKSTLLDLQWTYFHGRGDKKKKASLLDGMFPAFSLEEDSLKGDYATEAEMHWNVTLNMIDLVFHRCLHYGKRFSLTPSLGVRSAWIQQHGDVEYSGGSFNAGEDRVNLSSHFFGIGPRLGIDPKICFGSHFNVYGKAAGTLFYGWFHVEEEERFIDVEQESAARRINAFRWNVDLTAGIGWDRLIDSKKMQIDLDLGVDYLFFDHQNEFEHNRHMSGQGKNLHFWGGHVAATLKF